MYLRPAWNSQGDRGRELPPKARSLSQISQREKDVEQLEVVAGPWQTTRKTKQNKTKQNKNHGMKKAEHIHWEKTTIWSESMGKL